MIIIFLEIKYKPTNFFSFKELEATNTSATSLLMPTPFAVKMGLISECIEQYSINKAKELFKVIKPLKMNFKLPKEIVVNKMFKNITAINDKQKNEFGNQKWNAKPSFREYLYMKGNFYVALKIDGLEKNNIELLKELFININYFGTKNSFMQFKDMQKIKGLDNEYCSRLSETNDISQSILQTTEDVPENADFEHIDIYNSDKKLKREDNKITYVVNVKNTKTGDDFHYYKLR